MQAIGAFVTTVFTNIGTAVGASAVAAPSVGAGLLSVGLQTVSSISANNYNAAVATRAAMIRDQNANRLLEAGRKEAQMQDEQAAAAIADDIALSAASGFSVNSPSFVRRRQRTTELAGRDRANIVEDSILAAKSEREGAASLRSEASQYKRSNLFTLLSGAIGVGDTLIGGANLTSSVAARRTTNNARYVPYG